MTTAKPDGGYVPNPRYTQEDWDEVSDNPELTDEELARLRPAREVLPAALYEALTKNGQGPNKRMLSVTLSLDADIVEGFRAGGEGWERRMVDALRKAVGT